MCEMTCTLRAAQAPEFLLMVYLAFDEQLFLAYYTDEVRQVFVTPPGPNGDVGFTLAGYVRTEISAGVSRLTFELPLSMYGLWDMPDDRGRAYVFLLSTDRDRQIRDEAFLSLSNVVVAEF